MTANSKTETRLQDSSSLRCRASKLEHIHKGNLMQKEYFPDSKRYLQMKILGSRVAGYYYHTYSLMTNLMSPNGIDSKITKLYLNFEMIVRNRTTNIVRKARLMLLKLQNRPFEQCFIKLNTRNSRATRGHCWGSCQASLYTQKDIKDNSSAGQNAPEGG